MKWVKPKPLEISTSSFGVSHDAVAPQFYRFMKDDKSFVLLTDTGYVSDRMAGIVENADGYLIEANHDVEILRSGSTLGDSNNESYLTLVTFLTRTVLKL